MIIPHLTRKSYLFGVRIPAEEAGCEEAVQMKKNYMTVCLFGMKILLVICAAQFIFLREKTLFTTLYLPLFLIPVYFIAFVPNWKKALRLKKEQGWTVSNVSVTEIKSSNARGDLSSIPYIWYILGALIVFIVLLLTIIRYPLLPDLIPTNFNANMEADSWVEKSWLTALQLPLVNLGMLLIMFFVAVAIVKAKLQIDPHNPRLSFAQHRVYRRRMGHSIGFITLVISIIIAIPCFMLLYPDASVWNIDGKVLLWIMLILTILAIFPVIMVLIVTGQGGCKVKINPADIDSTNINTSEAQNKERIDDKYWKLGMFYYNPGDPAIIVEERFGSQLSFNFAHLPVKIGTGLLALSLIALYVWLTIILF